MKDNKVVGITLFPFPNRLGIQVARKDSHGHTKANLYECKWDTDRVLVMIERAINMITILYFDMAVEKRLKIEGRQ